MKFHRTEPAYGRCQRSFSQPDEADTGRITSEYKDGVLAVHMAKIRPPNPRLTRIR